MGFDRLRADRRYNPFALSLSKGGRLTGFDRLSPNGTHPSA